MTKNEIKEAFTCHADCYTELLEALKDVCQAYAWLTFGECRGWSESEPLTMQEALDKAETLITKAEGKQA